MAPSSGEPSGRAGSAPGTHHADLPPLDRSFHLPAEENRNVSDSQGLELCRSGAIQALTWIDEMTARSIHRLAAAEDSEGQASSVRSELESLRLRCAELSAKNRSLSSEVGELRSAKADLEARLSVSVQGELDIAITKLATLEEAKEFLEADLKLARSELEVEKVKNERLEDHSKFLKSACQESEARLFKAEEDRVQGVAEANKFRNMYRHVLSEIGWLIKEGIPRSLVQVLRSPEFRSSFLEVQGHSVRCGLHRGCAEMKGKYLSRDPSAVPLHEYPDAQDQARARFEALVREDFPLLKKLRSGMASVNELNSILGVHVGAVKTSGTMVVSGGVGGAGGAGGVGGGASGSAQGAGDAITGAGGSGIGGLSAGKIDSGDV